METNPVIMARRPSRRLSVAFDLTPRRESVNLLTGLPLSGRIGPETTWAPGQTVTKRQKKGDRNVIDGKSLYSIRRENIASREMKFVTTSPGEQGRQPVGNIEHLVEKNYIMGSRLKHATPEKFPNVIMRRFNRVSDHGQANSYGMPRPPTRTYFQKVMDGIKREPSVVNIQQFPSLHEPVSCSDSDEFCEILGPSSCQFCIENTNRAIGEQLQEMVFPMIDITTNKLIAPKLAKLLRKGHRHQVRRRRIQELGLDDAVPGPRRDGSHLSSSTCAKCRKDIKRSKIIVTSASERNWRLYESHQSRNDKF
ncbi:hypothetical protein MAR_016954 [Mya arenaria]|uniref:Uncharacterized protein n=1 Tax=Mya arenaria TaxID=6604 RepID=A0ABY7EDQ3_MYAAR|nr:hypothetical protein MAR_016954 [Mya arenaria]